MISDNYSASKVGTIGCERQNRWLHLTYQHPFSIADGLAVHNTQLIGKTSHWPTIIYCVITKTIIPNIYEPKIEVSKVHFGNITDYSYQSQTAESDQSHNRYSEIADYAHK